MMARRNARPVRRSLHFLRRRASTDGSRSHEAIRGYFLQRVAGFEGTHTGAEFMGDQALDDRDRRYVRH